MNIFFFVDKPILVIYIKIMRLEIFIFGLAVGVCWSLNFMDENSRKPRDINEVSEFKKWF